MPVEEWDVSCHDCHVRTDKRGIQIIHETGDTEIDYDEIATVDVETVPRANVLGRSAYVWGIVSITAIFTGLVMLSLVEFRQPFVYGYVGTVAITGGVALRKVWHVVKSVLNDEKAFRMSVETEDGERVTFTRDGDWPNGFDSHMLSKADTD